LGAPFLEFLGAGFFFHDLAPGFGGNEGVVGEIDLRALVEVFVDLRLGVFRLWLGRRTVRWAFWWK